MKRLQIDCKIICNVVNGLDLGIIIQKCSFYVVLVLLLHLEN